MRQLDFDERVVLHRVVPETIDTTEQGDERFIELLNEVRPFRFPGSDLSAVEQGRHNLVCQGQVVAFA